MATNTNMRTESSFTRRQFIKSNLAAALAAALGRDGQPAPSNRITL